MDCVRDMSNLAQVCKGSVKEALRMITRVRCYSCRGLFLSLFQHAMFPSNRVNT